MINPLLVGISMIWTAWRGIRSTEMARENAVVGNHFTQLIYNYLALRIPTPNIIETRCQPNHPINPNTE